jgi:NDP-sugar pyrophosphorylase family protein
MGKTYHGGDIKTDTMDVVILCGGKGKRLRTVIKDRPKVLAEINGQTFLDILIDYVTGFGFRRFIFCIGYKGDMIKRHFTIDYSRKSAFRTIRANLRYIFSEEKELLGTAGAIKKAQLLIKNNPFLVMNGDSICKLDLNRFINFHIEKRALFSMALCDVKNTASCGKVTLDNFGKVTSFSEKAKSNSENSLASAGIYLLDKAIFSEIPINKKCSIEHEIFPKLINRRFYGFKTEERLIDIGTPEGLKQANLFLKDGLHH